MEVAALHSVAADLLSGAGSASDTTEVGRVLERLRKSGALNLSLPGGGATATRFAAFTEFASLDLSLARLVEGHCDAIAILHELNHAAGQGTYGVWAAEGASSHVEAFRVAEGYRLSARGVCRIAGVWQAVGMADSNSLDVSSTTWLFRLMQPSVAPGSISVVLLTTGEDHALQQRLLRRRHRVVATRDTPVTTSSRVRGRAPQGFANFIAALKP